MTYVPYAEPGIETLREAALRIHAVFGVRPPMQPSVYGPNGWNL
jgi:hypothetical protein